MSQNICNDQENLDRALTKALNDYTGKTMEINNGWVVLYLILFFVFLFWAVTLAFKLKKSSERVIHLIFAIMTSPLYIICYYLNILKK